MVNIDLTEVLIGTISSIICYLLGHRRGRKIHRSGDYLVVKKEDPPLE